MSCAITPNELITIQLPTLTDTERFAKYLADCIALPMIITLSGDIGAGKTTLIRALLRVLGVTGAIKSPTYSIVETYDLSQPKCSTGDLGFCHHFDLYRIVDPSELDFIGFRDYFQANTLCCIEWPERMLFPSEHIDLALSLIKSEQGRTLLIQTNAKSAPMIHQSLENFNLDSEDLGR